MKDAIVAGENRSFWTDPGISVPGMVRAALSVVRGEDVVGGSTITQQYIKVLYLTQDKSYTRKSTEILLAAKMGNELSKEQILQGYLNTVYFGRGAYGVEAAAQAFFGKPVGKLTDPRRSRLPRWRTIRAGSILRAASSRPRICSSAISTRSTAWSRWAS